MKNSNQIRIREKLNILLILLIFISLKNTYAQWAPMGSVSGLGSWPSVFVLDQSTIFVAGGETGPVIWRSTDGGINFSQLPANGLPSSSSGRFLTCVWATSPNTIFAGDGSTSGNGLIKNSKVYKTTNGGTNWTTILNTGTNVYGFINGVVFSRTNTNVGIANSDPNSTTEKFKTWKTTNGGNNWTLFEADAPNSCGAQNSVFLIDENFFGFGLNTANARVALTTNGGANFIFSNLAGAGGDNGFVATVAFSSDKLNGIAGTSQTSTTVARTTNGGINWFAQTIPCTITGHCNVKWVTGTPVVYMVISNSSGTQCLKSVDNGSNWSFYTFPAGASNVSHTDLLYNYNKMLENEIYLFAANNTGNIFSLHEIPMPVTLSSFLYRVKENNTILNWTTSEEVNNFGFEIYRKPSSTEQDWINAGFLKGAGTKNTPTFYSFEDKNLKPGKYSYRLKQIDYNGNFEFFNLSSTVEIGKPDKFTLHPNYPNPFNSSTKISYSIPENGFVTLKIYDASGKEIKTLIKENQTAGNYNLIFSGSNLSTGTYFCRLESNNYSSIIKLLCIK
jgi:photosystem II stability/assembly factor-like uncharacterized protein